MELNEQKCQACEGFDVKSLNITEAEEYLNKLNGWSVNKDNTVISKTFHFKGFYKTMSFVNAVAWVANNEGHHPDMQVSYNKCVINFSTHSINALTINDFICAAKVDGLMHI